MPAASAWFDVFICYSRRDREFVERINAALGDGGKNVYVDWRIPDWSPDYENELLGAIDASDTFVFVLSPDSLASPHCKFELDRAVDQGKRIRPLLCRDVDDSAVPEALRKPQWLDFRRDDAFADEAARLLAAVNVDADWVQEHTRIGVRAGEWDRNGRDPSFLLRGSDLRDAEGWLAGQGGKEPAPTELHVQYVLASRRAAVRRQRVVLGAVVVALAVSIALALLALLQRNRAIDQRDNATSRGVALHALAEIDAGDFDRGVLLSLEALRTKPTFEARSAAIAAMGRSDRAEALLRSPSRASFSAVAISPDGRFVAAGGSDRAIHIWDRKTRRHYGKPLRLPRLDEPVSLTFGPQGQQLVAGYNDSNTTIWLLSPSGARAVPLQDAPGRSGYVPSAAVSPDGQTVATGGFEGEVDLWDARTGAHRARLRGARGAESANVEFVDDELLVDYVAGLLTIRHVRTGRVMARRRLPGEQLFEAFSPGGDRLATYDPVRVRYTVWDVRSQQQVGWVGPDSRGSAALSPDGATLALLSGGEVTLWEVLAGGSDRHDVPLVGDTQAVSIAFSNDGSRIATAGTGLVSLWRLSGGHQLVDVLAGDPHRERFLLDQNSEATVTFGRGSDEKALVWVTGDRATGDRATRKRGRVVVGTRTLSDFGTGYAVAVSPDAREVAIGGYDRVRVLRFDRRAVQTSLPVAAEALSWSPDGRWLATGASNGSVRLWDAETGAPLSKPVRANRNVVNGVAFNPAGTMLASVGYGDVVGRWTIVAGTNGQARLAPPRPSRLYGHSNAVTAAEFSPDSRLLATGDSGGTIRLWDAATGRAVGQALSAAGTSISDLAFHPDSAMLASAGDDGAVRLWDVAGARELGRPLRAHAGAVTSLSFRADGEQLASADVNNAVVVWDSVLWSTNWSRVANRLCAIVSRNLTRAEWEQFLPDQAYRVTCKRWPGPPG